MKKIKDLQRKLGKGISYKLQESEWLNNRLTKLSESIKSLIDRYERATLNVYISKRAKELARSKEDVKKIEIVGLNTLNNCINDPFLTGTAIRPKFQLELAMRTMAALAGGIGNIVDIQVMGGPVAQVFKMKYKTISTGNGGPFVQGRESGEDRVELSESRNNLTLEVVSQPVEARTRKLKGGFTCEAAHTHDLYDVHGQDIEKELLSILVAEAVQQTETEILNDILRACEVTEVDMFPSENTDVASFMGGSVDNIASRISMAADDIARKTCRGAGNFIVASPMVVSILQASAESAFTPAPEGSFKGSNNFMLVGKLNDTIDVYSYRWDQSLANDTSDMILIGYKGGSMGAGYLYAPYMPAFIGLPTVNEESFVPFAPILTRHGKDFHDANFYHVIKLKNLSFI